MGGRVALASPCDSHFSSPQRRRRDTPRTNSCVAYQPYSLAADKPTWKASFAFTRSAGRSGHGRRPRAQRRLDRLSLELPASSPKFSLSDKTSRQPLRVLDGKLGWLPISSERTAAARRTSEPQARAALPCHGLCWPLLASVKATSPARRTLLRNESECPTLGANPFLSGRASLFPVAVKMPWDAPREMAIWQYGRGVRTEKHRSPFQDSIGQSTDEGTAARQKTVPESQLVDKFPTTAATIVRHTCVHSVPPRRVLG
jgi:hypothetical protein